MAHWYYQKNGASIGPVETSTLKDLASVGQLLPSDLIWREGMSEWVGASQAKGLFPPGVPTTLPSTREPASLSAPSQSQQRANWVKVSAIVAGCILFICVTSAVLLVALGRHRDSDKSVVKAQPDNIESQTAATDITMPLPLKVTQGEAFLLGPDPSKRNDAEGIKLLSDAANRGSARAQYDLGMVYANGTGVTKDNFVAVSWFRKSADLGNADGQRELGSMFLDGRGVANDDSSALIWIRKAADQGDPLSQGEMGNLFENGQCVEKDPVEAVSWYRKAAERGLPDAQNDLGRLCQNGVRVEKDSNQAVTWYRKAAEQGFALGQYNLGYMYAIGEGVAQNYQEAMQWEQKSDAGGYSEAATVIGAFYLHGWGVPQDSKKAFDYYSKAANAGAVDE